MKKENEKTELKLVGVNKLYKLSNKETFQALYDINVEFKKGELVSIVGESGSGKSTLMNLIGGLDSDFSGDIISGGQNLRELSDKELDKYRKNHVGFVFQSFNLISHLSILDNVTLSLTISNVAEKEKIERATNILNRVGLSNQLKKKPTQLSGGQKQRVAIARALINDPEIIIADEPTGALDSQTSMQILEILKEIADSGKLVIMVTHSEKVASVSSRVVEISDGRIVGDHINKNYKKEKKNIISEDLETESQPASDQPSLVSHKQFDEDEELLPEKKKKRKNFREYKNKQNLSLRSAIRLSVHNMWASKTKNFLMAFGVAIGIGSLILMLCFSSGITDFIDNTMRSYSDPTIVTISKKGNKDDMTSLFGYNSFTSNEIDELLDGKSADDENGINKYLKQKYEDGTLPELFQINDENRDKVLVPGIQMMTMTTGAKVIYNPDKNWDIDYFNDPNTDSSKWLTNSDLKFESIIYLYTIPPYYTNTNVKEGKMSTKDKGIMFSSGIKKLFPDESILNEDGTNKTVDIAFSFTNGNKTSKLTFRGQEVTGIMDTSIMSNFMVMFIDYDYFQTLFSNNENTNGASLDPNVYYIRTPSKAYTDVINEYLETTKEYTGSIEEQLAGMFNNMASVIGTSLVVISCISLLVSAMMILVVLYMSVTERTKEIGVLKSIGARRKDIKRIFTSESFLIGVLSGVVGILFNFLLTFIVWLVLTNTIGLAPISYRWWYFFVALGVSVFIAMISGLYPASKAAKLDPVESLRRE